MSALLEPHPDDGASALDLVFMALGGHPGAAHRIAAATGAVAAAAQAPAAPAAGQRPELSGSLSGRVFHDSDGDGRFTDGDEGVAGVEVLLVGKTVRGQPVRGATKTRPDGRFAFEGLPPGTYAVARPGGPPLGQACVGTVNGQPVGEEQDGTVGRIGLPPGGLAEGYCFTEVRAGAVSGLVLVEDEDEDGTAESPAEGVVVLLTGVDGRGRVVQQSTRTGPRGAYRFAGLYPGHYDLFAAPPRGHASLRARPGDRGGRPDGAGKIGGLTLQSGAHATGYNFALLPPRAG